jgi:hypothetical protein
MHYRLLFSLLLACLYFTAHAQTGFDPAVAAAINLDDLPVLPAITDTAREIYARGQDAGRDSHAVAKVGDCMTASENFLVPFSTFGTYNLGAYDDLQPVVDYFALTFARSATTTGAASTPALATTTGFTTVSVQDPIWADPAYCPANESPLACEYRVSNAAFALIMFGTNDTTFFDPESFNTYLRQLLDETIAADIVPVLYTFPERPEFPDKSILFNQIIAQIAQEYDLPLINLYRSLEDLPDKGINLAEPIHLSSPIDGNAGDFTPENLERGYTLRNLVTLQSLDVLYKGLVLGENMATPEATAAS